MIRFCFIFIPINNNLLIQQQCDKFEYIMSNKIKKKILQKRRRKVNDTIIEKRVLKIVWLVGVW